MRRIVFATNNDHKLYEIKKALNEKFEVVSLKEIGFNSEISEDYETLQENAHQKAETVVDFLGEKFKGLVFADDTGLEVDALDGRPGVYSARYAGINCSFQDNVDKMLEEMTGIENRNAQFRTVIALVNHSSSNYFEGIVKGEILNSSQGNEGFGYDPIFSPNGFNESFAEMSIEAKNLISHRGLAVQKVVDFLIR